MRRGLSLLGLALLLACAPAASAAPTWERSFGNDVGGPGADVCTVAATCVAGSQAGTEGGTFLTAADTAIDADGNVYVVDDFMERVTKFTATGAFVRAWGWSVHKDLPGQFGICTVAADCRAGERAPDGGALASPSGIAVSRAGEVYVAETDANRISVFTTDGAFVRTIGEGVSTGAAAVETCAVAATCRPGGATGIPGSFDKPRGIAFDSTGSYWVAEVANPRVQKFNAADDFNLMVGKNVGGPGMDRCISILLCGAASPTGLPRGGQWAAVEGIGTGVGDRVFVTDSQSNSVTVLSSDGSFERVLGKDVMGPGTKICNAPTLCVPGAAGGGGGEFTSPSGVTGDSAGNMYVSERLADRVQIITWQGTFQAVLGKNVDDRFPNMFAVCSESTHCRAGAPGGKGGEISQSWSLEVSPLGDLYVGEYNGARVSKFRNPIAPPQPAITGFTPASPSNQNSPRIRGTTLAGTTIRIYRGLGCVGAPIAEGTREQFAAGLTVTVADNTTTQFTARAVAGGIESFCTPGATYVEDSAPPAPPAIAATSPSSPANDPSPRVQGTAEAGASVRVFTNDTCSGPAGATGSAAEFASPGFVVGVPPGNQAFYATATDEAGNVSACSEGLPYTYTGDVIVATGPGAPAPDTFVTGGPEGGGWLTVPTFTFRSDTPGAKFQCRVDGGAWATCDRGSYTTAPLGVGAHRFEVAAIAAGNVVDPTPARRDFSINAKKTEPLSCELNPFLATGRGSLFSRVPNACDISTDGKTSFNHSWSECESDPGDTIGALCSTVKVPCPKGARCTLKTTVAFQHEDTNTWWHVGTQRIFQPFVDIRAAECEIDYGQRRCQASQSVSFLGQPTEFGFNCWARQYFPGDRLGDGTTVPEPPGSQRFGDANGRALGCKASLTIEAAAPLVPVGVPGGAHVFVPGAGTLSVTPGGGLGGRSATASARRAPVFKAIKKTVTAPGAVPLTFKLSSAANKTYKRKRRLPLSLKVTFTPAGGVGAASTRTVKVALRPAERGLTERQLCQRAKKRNAKLRCP